MFHYLTQSCDNDLKFPCVFFCLTLHGQDVSPEGFWREEIVREESLHRIAPHIGKGALQAFQLDINGLREAFSRGERIFHNIFFHFSVCFLDFWGIMANMVLCVIPGQGNSKILNLVKSGSFDSPIFLYIPNDEKTSTGHLIWPQPFIWQPFLEISCPGMTLWI